VYVKAIEVCESKFTGAIVSPPRPVGRNQSCPIAGRESGVQTTDLCATHELWEKQKGAAILE